MHRCHPACIRLFLERGYITKDGREGFRCPLGHQDNVSWYNDFEVAYEENQLSVEDETPLPVTLKGNYTNPFNPITTIEFLLPETGFTELVIYNLTGQRVRELICGTMSDGIHSVVLNGRDNNGLHVSAGVYITRLKIGDAVRTGRMMLVK